MVRVRFAPSPTGRLHIGNARTALFNWVYSRKYGGRFILRIEDTDIERSHEDFIAAIIEDLKWLGLDWDEGPGKEGPYGPYVQSQRLHFYKEHLDKLNAAGCLYECFCSAAELEERRKKLLANGGTPRYDNRCRGLAEKDKELYRSAGRKPVLRFKVPDNRKIIINDLIRGEVEFNSAIMGDFVVQKSDGMPMFNFAVCVDDYLMNITHIIRGEDHLPNTPRHVLIFEALGAAVPKFAHMSMTLGPSGEKLSKRLESASINHYRKQGYLPRALFNYLALLGWAPKGKDEILPREKIIAEFNIEDMNKSSAIFDQDKLNWLSGHYIRESDIDALTRLCLDYLKEAGYLAGEVNPEKFEWLKQITLAVRDHLKKAGDILLYADIFFKDEITFNEAAAAILSQDKARDILSRMLSAINRDMDKVTLESFKAMMKEIQAQTGIKGKDLYLPARAALTGRTEGPELVVVLPLLGKEVCLKRIKQALQYK